MSIYEKLVGVGADKKAFREYRRRGEALPKEYRTVWKGIEKYFFTCGPMDGSPDILSGIVTLFETGAADGRSVLEITGDDVAGFCDGLIEEWRGRTWMGQLREKTNRKIHEQLEAIRKV